MRVCGYTVTRRPFWNRTLPWMLFCWMSVTLFQAISETHFFAPYRYGDVIVPKQEQLVKSGPYFMKIHPIRSFYDVEFISTTGGDSYVVDSTVFPQRIYMRGIAETEADHAVAYLWMYKDNPVQKVWRVDVGEQNVLSYEEALKSYRVKFETGILMLYLSAISFFFLIWSLTSIKRTA